MRSLKLSVLKVWLVVGLLLAKLFATVAAVGSGAVGSTL